MADYEADIERSEDEQGAEQERRKAAPQHSSATFKLTSEAGRPIRVRVSAELVNRNGNNGSRSETDRHTDADRGDPRRRVRLKEESVLAYIETKVQPQKDWYHKKATTSKQWHYGLVIAQLSVAALIPISSMLTRDNNVFAYVSALLAAFSGFAVALSSFGRYQENWIRYRKGAEMLGELIESYRLQLPPFSGSDRDADFVEQVQAVFSEERDRWLSTVSQQKLDRRRESAPENDDK